MATENPGPEEDFSGIPLDDRLSHKNWKARVSGYEDLAKKFRTLEDDSSEYAKYSYDMKKYVSDTNAAALEKGLDVAAAFLQYAKMDLAGKSVQDIMQGITAKCFNARPKAKELAYTVCLFCVEVEKQDIVIEELVAGCTAKIPKVVIGCIAAITNIIANFGAHIIQVKILLKGLAAPFAHNDKNIRNEAKNLSIELCRWLKADVLRICLKDLKPVQLKELEEEWKKLADETPKPTRFLRSKQNEPEEAVADDQGESGGETTPIKDKSPLFDPLEMIDPIDLRKHFPPDFFQLLTSAKWSERKDAMGLFLEEATKVVKVLPADYSELLTAMHKIITKDTNVNCVQNAAKVVAVLAKGLKGQFEPQAKHFLTAILEKMKEKKVAVVSVLSECADAIYQTSTMLFLHEEILEALENKNPNVKSETCLFTARSLCYCSPTTLTKPIIKVLVPSLLKRLDDTTPQVRDAASLALGTCLKILGDRPLNAYFEDVDKNKKAKIQEASDKAELKVSQGAKKSATKAKEPAKKEEKPPTKAKEDKPKTVKKAVTKTTKSTNITKSNSKANITAKSTAKTSSKVKTDDFMPNFENEPSYSPEELDAMAQECFGEDILTRLSDSKWKDRVDACTEVKEMLETIDEKEINSQLYIHVIMVKPGLADGNLQAMNIKFSMIGFLAKRAPDWGTRCTEAVIATLGEKLGEIRLKATSTESLFCISERIQSLHHVALTVMSVCTNHKSPKIQTEGFIWLATALVEFGLKVKLPAFVGYIKTGLSSTNPNIKTASLKLLSSFAVFFSTNIDAFKGMLGELNPNIVSKVDKEIKVATENPPSKPTRSLKPMGDDDTATDDSSSMSMDDMIPRVDISSNFKGAIMDNLADKKDWKMRNEALQEIQAILKQNPCITPNLGSLPPGLKARLGDTNKNLVCTTLSIIGSLAAKLGPGLTKIVRVLLPTVLNVLSDAKANVREAAILTLNAWHENLKLISFFDYEMILTALKTDNPNLRADLMSWISERIKDVPVNTLPKTELLAIIPSVGLALEDRAAPVRDKAKILLMSMVESLGKEAVTKASAKAPGQVLKQMLNKIPSQQSAQSMDNAVEPETAKQPESEPTPTTTATKTEKSEKSSNVAKVKVPPPEPEEIKPFRMGPSREQRESEEKKLGSRCPRWEFDQPSTDHIRYVRNQLEKCMDVTLLDKMLDNDFQKHEPAIKFIIGPSCLKGPCEREIINCTDLIFKFISMKLTEKNNTKILKLSLEFLRVLLEILSDKNYTMSDNEATCIIPFIVQRMGNPNETLRKEVRHIIQLFTHIYTTSKIYMMVSVGLVSRNSKLKVDCIEFLGELIRDQGTGVCTPTPQKAVETLAKSISDSDHKTKTAALTCMVYVFNHIGETLFKYVGNIPPKDKDMLQDKIKKYGMAPSSSPVPTSKFEQQNSKATSRSTDNLHEPSPSAIENVPEPIEPEPTHDQPPPLGSDPLLEADINIPTAPPQIEPQSYPRSVPTQRMPQLTIPQTAGPFSVDVDSICKKHELVQTTPLSKLKRPTGYEELLKKPTNTTNYQTSVLYARAQYVDDLPAIINNLASQDLTKVDENNRKLEQIINLQPFQVVDYVDSIIEAALIQISTCESMLASRSTTDHMLSVLRGILSCLMNVLDIRVLCKKIKQQNLKELFKHLAHLLTNPGLNTFDEGVQVIRALNLLTARILESVDQNELFTVLLDLMLQSLTREGTPSITTDIYMKCIWRLTRSLNDNIRLIKVNRLLFDVDQFFIAYTRVGTTPRSEDKLFKTAKTIVFHVANSLDTEVWDYTDLIVKPEQSLVCRNIRNTLNKLNKSHDSTLSSNSDVSIRNPSTLNQGMDSSMSSEGVHAKMSPATRFRAQLNQGMEDVGDERVGNQEVNSRLAQIFTRIGAREISGQGLADLYNFMLANPTTDLRPFLKSTSNIFQGYIERGLQSIERDMKNPFKETSKIYQGDIETRSSYLRLREKARRTMDLELPLPPKQATSYSPGLPVNAPREDFNQRNLRQPQSQTSARLSPQDPQQRSAPRDLASLRKRLELATNSTTSTQPVVTSAPDKITELRERFSRLQQQNI